MQNFLRISNAVSLAFHTMWLLAERADRRLNTPDIAKTLDVSEHHLQKVHQRLAKAGFIQAVRGPRGGFRLLRPAEEITLLEVFEAIDGPFNPCHCMLGHPGCRVNGCILGNLVDRVDSLVYDHLRQFTVAELAQTPLSKTVGRQQQ
jgi:Rrf2 family protein